MCGGEVTLALHVSLDRCRPPEGDAALANLRWNPCHLERGAAAAQAARVTICAAEKGNVLSAECARSALASIEAQG